MGVVFVVIGIIDVVGSFVGVANTLLWAAVESDSRARLKRSWSLSSVSLDDDEEEEGGVDDDDDDDDEEVDDEKSDSSDIWLLLLL